MDDERYRQWAQKHPIAFGACFAIMWIVAGGIFSHLSRGSDWRLTVGSGVLVGVVAAVFAAKGNLMRFGD